MENNLIIMKTDTCDRISQLPDSILHHIMSYLDSPKDLVRMSVLTKNWFTLTASFPILNFCIHTFYKVIKSSGFPFDTDKDKREAFFKYVEYTISRFSEQNVSVHTVKLYTGGLKDAAKVDITDKCLRLIKKGIKVLEISAATWPIYVEQPMYRLPDILLSAASLTSLKLCACELPSSLKVDAIKFKYLKYLHLNSVLLDEEMINRLTMSCPLLEQLCIYCHGFKTFRVQGLDSLQTLFLKFKDEVEEINIEASNLRFLGLMDGGGGVAPSMNFASCKKLTSMCYSGNPSLTSDGLADLSSNFPFLEDLNLYLPYECNNLTLTSHSLRTFVLHSRCDLEQIHMNTPKLLSFYYWGYSNYPSTRVWNETLLKPRMECFPGYVVDTNWFGKVRRFMDYKIGFKALRFHINVGLINVEELKVIQTPPFKLEHLELETSNIKKLSVYEGVVDAMLWCFCPRSLTLESTCSYLNFDEQVYIVKFAYEKLLQQEDQGPTNIQIVLSSTSKAKEQFTNLSSLLTSLPCGRLIRETITFIKEEALS